MPRDQVFISYAREDVELMKEFRTMLDPLVRSGETAAWADTDIPPGANWSDEINQALASARIGVLLVSADFLASDFIMETEVPALEAAAATGELTLIWIATRHCLYEASPLSKYQAAIIPKNHSQASQKTTARNSWPKSVGRFRQRFRFPARSLPARWVK